MHFKIFRPALMTLWKNYYNWKMVEFVCQIFWANSFKRIFTDPFFKEDSKLSHPFSSEREITFLSLSQLVEKVSSSLSLSLFLSHFKDGCFFDGFSDKMTNLMQINIDV